MITSGNYEQDSGAKRALMLGAAVLICTPMVLSLLLLLAVASPKMDKVTMHLPRAVRSTVASGILAGVDYGKDKGKQERAKRLDAETAAAYRPPILGLTVADARRVEIKQKTSDDLVKRAAALEKDGKDCEAEELYTRAASQNASGVAYEYTEGMGRSGLRCGDLPGARAGLESAVIMEKKFIEDDDDDVNKAQQDMTLDQQYLIVVYDKEHETALAKQTCSDVNPKAKLCMCKLIPKGVSCSYKPR